MPKYRVTGCYYDSVEVEAKDENHAIDIAHDSLERPGGLFFDEYEVECLDDEEDDDD